MDSLGTSSLAPTQLVEFDCDEWLAQRNGDTGELISIQPVAGTWTLIGGEDRRRFCERGMNVKALFACPRCAQVGLIPEGFNPPKDRGDTLPLPEMHCRRCDFTCRAILKKWDQRKLYCVTYETKKGDSLQPHKEYLHAVDQEEALAFFWAGHGGQVSLSTDISSAIPKDGTITNLVGVAPVIGFFANPKSERKLIV